MADRLRTSVVTLCLIALSGCAMQPNGKDPIKSIAVTGAPKAAGPYSQGVVAGGMLYTAGMVPRDPVTGNLVEGDITAQSNRVFDSIEAILRGAGCGFKDVVKLTVFLTDMADFAKFNEVMIARFGDNKPARSTVQVSKTPTAGALVEVDAIALLPK